jgi:hypothetical protein
MGDERCTTETTLYVGPWVPIELAEPGTTLDVEGQHGHLGGTTPALPFVDPKKAVPAASLR